MRKLLTFLIFYLSSVLCHPAKAQVAIEWQHTYGGSSSEGAMSMDQTSDGGTIVLGTTTSSNGDVTLPHGAIDLWLIKLDSLGNLQWQKTMGGTSNDFGTAVKVASDGGYIITGSTYSNNGDVSGNNGGYDVWVVKTNASGDIQWQNCLGGTLEDWPNAVYPTTDNGYIVAGKSMSTDGDVTGNHGDFDFWVLKLDSVGNLEWEKSLGGTLIDEAYAVQQTADGNYVVAGRTRSNNGDVTGNHGLNDFWLVKLDTAGAIIWQKTRGGAFDELALSMQQTADGGYIIGGNSAGNSGEVTGIQGLMDCWIVKTDNLGNLQWQTSLGGTASDYTNALVQTSDGGYIVMARTNSNDGDVIGAKGGNDGWIVKLDGSGNKLWSRILGGPATDMTRALVDNQDGSIVIAGSTFSNSGDVSLNKGMDDFWILKLTTNINSITGKAFFDFNSNAIQNPGDIPVTNHLVFESTSGKIDFTDYDGDYNVELIESGNFTVIPSAFNTIYSAAPVTHNAYFSAINQVDSLNDFAFQPIGVANDLCLSITPTGPFRSGVYASYNIHYENVGNSTINGTILFFPDTNVTFSYSAPLPTTVTVDSVIWSTGTLLPFQSGNILVTVIVDPGTPVGTLINSGARVEPVANDVNPYCNSDYYEVFVVASLDPNDILVDRDTLYTFEFPNPPYLDYLIRFQNTGNDTAFYVNVLNNLDAELDAVTFDLIAVSHPMTIHYGAHSRLLEFTFNSILLPDSNVNEAESHGFIRYRIKPHDNLIAGDLITSTAAIYFDSNLPVITNTAVTQVVLPTSTNELQVTSDKLKVFPNPFRDEITIELSSMEGQSVAVGIFDIYGRLVSQIFGGRVTSDKLQVTSNLDGLCSGIYFVRMESDLGSQHVKIIKY